MMKKKRGKKRSGERSAELKTKPVEPIGIFFVVPLGWRKVRGVEAKNYY